MDSGYLGTWPINGDELELARNVALGRETEFPSRRPVIRAELIRDLLFGRARNGHARHGHGGPIGANLAGVRLSRATIHGKLDLSDTARPGDGLPALELRNCTFDDELDFTSARVARLSLEGSTVRTVRLRDAYIDGPLDLSGVHGLECDQCWIDGRGAQINGDVTTSATRLWLNARSRPPSGERRAALWLAGATIHGSVRMDRDCVVFGGVSLDAARVHGDVRVSNSALISGETDAFNCRGATIDGVLYVRRCEMTGVMWMMGVRVDGSLEVSDTTINGAIDPWEKERLAEARQNPSSRRCPSGIVDPEEARKAMVLADSEIGGGLRLTPGFVATGQVSIADTKLQGSFDATGARMRNRVPRTGRGRTLIASNAAIGASLLLDGTDICGRIDLAGARIGGKLSLLDAHGNNRTDNREGQALEAVNVTVGGNVEFGRDDEPHGSSWCGAVNLTGMQVGGDLLFSRTRIANLLSTPPASDRTDAGTAIIARRIRVRGSIVFDSDFRSSGAVLLSGASVGRNLLCSHATLTNPLRSALYAKDAEIGDDLRLHRCTAVGDLRFDRIAVTGAVMWEHLTLEPGIRDRRKGLRLDLQHAKVGARLRWDKIHSQHPYRVDLTGMEVANIELKDHRREATECAVCLDGLVYERIELLGMDPRYPPRKKLRVGARVPCGDLCWWGPQSGGDSDRLLDWLLQYQNHPTIDFDKPPARDDRKFRPQPFLHLANVLRRQGREAEARAVAVGAQWATPRTGISELAWTLFGLGFGFGQRPWMALATLSAYILLGSIGVDYALVHDRLEETPHIAAGAFEKTYDDRLERGFLPTSQKGVVQHLPCYELDGVTDSIIYAADTVLPFIPFHHEAKCEIYPEYSGWRLSRAVYMVVGWIITSITIITMSGIVRRFESSTE